MNCNKDDGGIDTATANSSDGQHHHHMSKLANGINKIVVKCNEEAQNNNMPTLRRKNSTGSLNSTGSGGMILSSNNNVSVGASLSYAKAATASSGNMMNDIDDCDKSISGASLERRSSFRSRAGKAYSPRWVDQKHNYQHDNLQQHHNTQGYETDDKSAASFSQVKRKSGEMFHSHHHDTASQASFGGGGHDSHDEGYLSQHSSTGYDHSYHPALSYAASVKSDIATVCSGSVVEDIDMEMGSVASDGGKKPPPQHHQPKDDVKPKGVEFASNILNPLNDMGPPTALCSALLLAANAACQSNSNSLGFSEQQSDVEAHVDTDDCCDRSIDAESEVSTLHSQEDDASHNLDESERNRPSGGTKSDSQHSLPLQRFQQGQVDLSHLSSLSHEHLTDNPNFPPLQHAEERADDWSNSRSHSRSPSRSTSPSSSTKSKCSRSRSRSKSPEQANRPSWYREKESQPPQAANADMEDADTEEPKYRVDFSSKIE